MKGVSKFVKRAPTMLGSKVGMSKRSTDPEFDDFARNFAIMEQSTEKLIKDTKAFSDGVIAMFTSASEFAKHFSVLFHPLAGEYDVLGKYPNATRTAQSVDKLEVLAEDLRTSMSPEIELIASRIIGPAKEFQLILKAIRKSITKREHKLIDFDRLNNSLTKLRDKKEKSLNDESNLFKLEQDFEIASSDYEYLNNTLKVEIPRFMIMATRFIEPIFHSFFYMQLNVLYMTLEKMNEFAESRQYEVSGISGARITADYEGSRTDAWEQIDNLNITKRFASTAKLVHTNRGLSGADVKRAASTATTASMSSRTSPPVRAGSNASSFVKKAPPPPPQSSQLAQAPPPYAVTTSTLATRKPPPPPPLKSKPPAAPAIQYVTAVYDFDAQADGDLSFKAGDRIQVVERSATAEDWWTGKIGGRQGVFPGNYVQD